MYVVLIYQLFGYNSGKIQRKVISLHQCQIDFAQNKSEKGFSFLQRNNARHGGLSHITSAFEANSAVSLYIELFRILALLARYRV